MLNNEVGLRRLIAEYAGFPLGKNASQCRKALLTLVIDDDDDDGMIDEYHSTNSPGDKEIDFVWICFRMEGGRARGFRRARVSHSLDLRKILATTNDDPIDRPGRCYFPLYPELFNSFHLFIHSFSSMRSIQSMRSYQDMEAPSWSPDSTVPLSFTSTSSTTPPPPLVRPRYRWWRTLGLVSGAVLGIAATVGTVVGVVAASVQRNQQKAMSNNNNANSNTNNAVSSQTDDPPVSLLFPSPAPFTAPSGGVSSPTPVSPTSVPQHQQQEPLAVASHPKTPTPTLKPNPGTVVFVNSTPTSTSSTSSSTSSSSFRLKMHWEPSYNWQDEVGVERHWCLECATCNRLNFDGDGCDCQESAFKPEQPATTSMPQGKQQQRACFVDNQVWIRDCHSSTGAPVYFAIQSIAGGVFDQIRIVPQSQSQSPSQSQATNAPSSSFSSSSPPPSRSPPIVGNSTKNTEANQPNNTADRSNRLCLQRTKSRFVTVQECNATLVEQLWLPVAKTTNDDNGASTASTPSSFALVPADRIDLCLTQQHHPKEYEPVGLKDCAVAETTRYWEMYNNNNNINNTTGSMGAPPQQANTESTSFAK